MLWETERLLSKMVQNGRFDSYAVYVRSGELEAELYSNGLNETTFFDIASMGKVLVTATLILKAVGDNKLSLADTLNMFFDDVPRDKRAITVEQLLTHTSGIIRHAFVSKELADQGHSAIAKKILGNPLAFLPGTDYAYSCEGFILLGFIIEQIYNLPLDKAYAELIQDPLDIDGCVFNLSANEPNRVISYYTAEEPSCLVADLSCNAMNGIAGNGCSFWTMNSLKKYAKAILSKDERLYNKQIFELAERDHTPNFSEGRGLGWLITDERYNQTGELFENGSFGHCGNTGTSFFFNREQDICVILLTNATRYSYMRRNYITNDYGETMEMRKNVHNAIFCDLNKE